MLNRRTVLKSTGAAALGTAAVPHLHHASRKSRQERPTDYLVVGSGPAGTVLASRLSENPHISVTLLEAGAENTNEVGRIQGAFFKVWGTEQDWTYTTINQPGLGGRSISQPRGKVIGGSAAINVGAWLRGVPQDYDSWQRAGAARLSGTGAVETFKRLEHTSRAAASPLRGGQGPIQLAQLELATPLSTTLADAFTEAGFGPRGDVDAESPYVIDRFETIFPDHRRRTPADAMLSPDIRRRPNLTVISGAHVTQVMFSGNRAVGVEFLQNKTTQLIKAGRGVVLAAGAYNTPQLLMLSGIGPTQHLRSLGIPTLVNAPGVGANLQDHLGVPLRALGHTATTGSIPMAARDEWIAQWMRDRTGPANYFQENNVGFIKTTRHTPWPDFELLPSYNPDFGTDGQYFAHVPDKGQRAGYTLTVVQLHPRSRGRLQLTSPDPTAKPTIDLGYLTDPRDLKEFITGLRTAHRMLQTRTLAPYSEFVFPEADADDDTYRTLIQQNGHTMYHPVGTARMGHLSDPHVVVDPDFRVRGTSNLFVADASIFPHLISGHTMAPSMYVGEIAAQLIRTNH
ncbi:Choline dehydrogenase [Streptomyces sp. KS_5]|nr:GMC oxidoreductase [Streptomyces sp. KS_5]SEE35962.1 Choline dehydrogenase [Streptomyces sp. KS_5]